MKKSILTLFVASILSLNFSSCDRFPSQGQNEIHKAFLAILKQDLSSFRSLLQGKALDEFGTPDGMDRLEKTIRGVVLTVGASLPLAETKYSDHNWPTFCVYQIPIFYDGTEAVEAYLSTKISCRLGYSRPNSARMATEVNPGIDCSRDFILDQRNNMNRERCHIEEIEIL